MTTHDQFDAIFEWVWLAIGLALLPLALPLYAAVRLYGWWAGR